MKTYAIFLSEYCHAQAVASEIKDFLNNNHFQEDQKNPDLAIVIGGDGTFLRTCQALWKSIDHTVFAIVNAGSIGFYSQFYKSKLKDLYKELINPQPRIIDYGLVEVSFNQNQKLLAINEVKVINNNKPLQLEIYINDQLLEKFRGTGLVFATNSGTTGFMRSVKGAIILTEKNKLWEMQELAPVAHAKFFTLNSPIIFDEHHQIKLQGWFENASLVVDTLPILITHSDIKIKMSRKVCRILANPQQDLSKVELWRKLFLNNT